MTHEEIINRTIDAAAAIDKGDSAVTVIKLRPHFESIVRATLEEAARAGCWYCKNSNVATFETDDAVHGGWFHHFDDETPSDRCRSAAIHDLIAALDKEASHE